MNEQLYLITERQLKELRLSIERTYEKQKEIEQLLREAMISFNHLKEIIDRREQ